MPALQRLLSFGLQGQPPGAQPACPAPAMAAPTAATAAAAPPARQPAAAAAARGDGGSYVPPHLRRATAEGQAASSGGASQPSGASAQPQQPPGSTGSSRRASSSEPGARSRAAGAWGLNAAAVPPPGSPQRQPPGAGRRSSSGGGRQGGLESSDSELSDSEGPGGGGGAARASRVRAAALAVLQALAKADSKALHPSWTALLPTSEAVSGQSKQCDPYSLGSQDCGRPPMQAALSRGGAWLGQLFNPPLLTHTTAPPVPPHRCWLPGPHRHHPAPPRSPTHCCTTQCPECARQQQSPSLPCWRGLPRGPTWGWQSAPTRSGSLSGAGGVWMAACGCSSEGSGDGASWDEVY